MSRCTFTRPGLMLVLIIIGIVATAQQPNNNTQWKSIDALIAKGLNKSALDQVDAIYNSAKKTGNNTQVIKALLYQLHLQQNLEEDAEVKGIQLLEEEIRQANGTEKSILYSITAEQYFNYYQQNRWKFFERTTVENLGSDDISAWSIDQFYQKIGAYYLASIADEKVLQQVNINAYHDVLVKGNTDQLRPTLYDLLANRAINYFNNNERDIQRPAYAFELEDEAVFTPATQFITYKFKTEDSASLHFKALEIFQKLLRFHLHDPNIEALINTDIERLQFAESYFVGENKISLYIQALQKIFNSNMGDGVAQAGYLIAQKIYESAGKQAYESALGYSLAQAKSVADSVIRKYPKSEGGINAANLIKSITRPSLTLNTEKINVPDKPFRTLVSYKNISTIHLRVVSVTPTIIARMKATQNEDKFWPILLNEKPLKTWEQPLPQPNDFENHSAEIKIDRLPVGEYILLASISNDFSLNKNALALQYFYVSNISFINNNNEYFVLNRESGQPLKDATVQVWNEGYDYKTSTYNPIKQEKITADKNGYFKLREPRKDENRNIRLEISTANDHLFLEDGQYYNQYYNSIEENTRANSQTTINYEKENARIYLFTDRSIYRPGQLVYFKGIAVTNDFKTKRSKIFQSKDSVKVILRDANSDDIDSLSLKLNDFGSVSGNFKLPEGRMNGNFVIEAMNFGNSTASFNVEEYKRPKFYAEFQKLKQSYRLNDSITLKGLAKGYAGNNINDATVTYTVRRIAKFIYPWLFRRWPMPQTRPLEIAHGISKTDADGNFTIMFKALPDLSIDKKTEPVFDYEVETGVTDAAGETRSAKTIISVGYKSLDLKINMPANELISADSLKTITVTVQNLAGEKVPALADIRVIKLQAPTGLIRKRYWGKPDQFVMTEEEFSKYFPLDEYGNELEKESWAKGDTVMQSFDSANLSRSIVNKVLPEGWYAIEASAKDKDGLEVKDIKYVQVYHAKKTMLSQPAYNYTMLSGSEFQPGDKVTIINGTSAKNIFLIQQEVRSIKTNDKDTTLSTYQFSNLNNEKKSFDFAITDNDRGGFTVHQFFVKDNRVYNSTQFINVPWRNKQLDVTYTTFRDKTLPGSKEEWKVKINGYKGEKVAAEMLAAMYDASLDQFKEHSWQVPDVWPINFNYNRWSSDQNFTSVTSRDKGADENYIEVKEKIFSDFIFSSNFSFDARVRFKARGIASDAMIEMKSNAPALQEVVATAMSVKKRNQFTPPKVVMDEEMIVVEKKTPQPPTTSIRKNFNETAFFLPQLNTDKNGNVEFSFTMPEALTTWKLLTLAHTKELAFGYNERSLITQKELMIQANAPRFLREGDRMEFSANVTNLTDKEITGQAELELFEASTMKPVDGLFKNIFPSQYFTVDANKTNAVKFTLEVPFNFSDALVYRITAKSGNKNDGEEAPLPILTNRMLVTETLLLNTRGDSVKRFTFDKLLNSGKSETLKSHSLTIEYSTNPAWYAIQALPYLTEPKYECADYLFNSYYANTLAQYISKSSPKIAEILKLWQKDTANFKSNLQKNEELKAVLLQETPWLLEAMNETAQMRQLANLFDTAKLGLKLNTTFEKLADWQSSNGGFMWFKGGPEDRYITQYVISGLARLLNLKAILPLQELQVKAMIEKALPYLDAAIKKDYDELKKSKPSLKIGYPFYPQSITAQYFYLRSLLPAYKVPEKIQPAYNYYRTQLKANWLKQNKYTQAMIALALYRTIDKSTAMAILKSLKENAIINEELGMYWKDWSASGGGYLWYQAPVESQAMMIEAFSEIGNDDKTVDDLKTWLLKNKQTNSWPTSKATADACYALLLKGSDWLSVEQKVNITVGDTLIQSDKLPQQAGTGYFKYVITEKKVTPEMGKISVKISAAGKPATSTWGGAYWQYFEDLDKITFAQTPLKLNKKLFITTNTDRGPVLKPITNNAGLKVGDKITVRIELQADRDMEYIHMKDMRAACMEPVSVLSTYKYQGGLGYYESTKDASTNFFFSYLPKGNYIFEYTLFVTHSGNFSNGITSIQCLYAPQFTAHSEGTRVNVE